MPVVIHQRNSYDAIMEIMEPYHGKIRAVFHCFSAGPEQARHLIDLGHLVWSSPHFAIRRVDRAADGTELVGGG